MTMIEDLFTIAGDRSYKIKQVFRKKAIKRTNQICNIWFKLFLEAVNLNWDSYLIDALKHWLYIIIKGFGEIGQYIILLNESNKSLIRLNIFKIIICPKIYRVKISSLISYLNVINVLENILIEMITFLQDDNQYMWDIFYYFISQHSRCLTVESLEKISTNQNFNFVKTMEEHMKIVLPVQSNISFSIQFSVLKIYNKMMYEYVLSSDEIYSEFWQNTVFSIMEKSGNIEEFTKHDSKLEDVYVICFTSALKILQKWVKYKLNNNKIFKKKYLDTLFVVCKQYKEGSIMSEWNLYDILNYLNEATSDPELLEYMMPYLLTLVKDFFFKSTTFYEQTKYDYFSESYRLDTYFHYEVEIPCKNTLVKFCSVDKCILHSTISFINDVLTSSNEYNWNTFRAFRFIRTISPLLVNNYLSELQFMLVNYILPVFDAPHNNLLLGISARIIISMASANFLDNTIWPIVIDRLIDILINNCDLNLRCISTNALSSLYEYHHDIVRSALLDNIHLITLKIFHLLKHTKNQNLFIFVKKICEEFKSQIITILPSIVDLMHPFTYSRDEAMSDDNYIIKETFKKKFTMK